MMVPISISPKRIAKSAFFIVLFLTMLSVSGHLLQFFFGRSRFVEFVRLLNLGEEANVPTWFSSILLLAVALILVTIGIASKHIGNKHATYWMILSGIFVFLSLDEIAKIHDRTIEKPLVDAFDPHGIWHFPWVIPGWILVLIIGLIFWRFLRELQPKFRNLFSYAAGVYLTGALVLEMVSAYLFDFYLEAILARGVVATTQEFLEMTGLVIFIYALLVYLNENFIGLEVIIQEEG